MEVNDVHTKDIKEALEKWSFARYPIVKVWLEWLINENERLIDSIDKQHDEFYNQVRIAHQDKEMASYRHAQYAGELREEIKTLKEAFEENKKEIDTRGLICQRYRRALEEIGAKHEPPASKVANDALWDVEQMHKLKSYFDE